MPRPVDQEPSRSRRTGPTLIRRVLVATAAGVALAASPACQPGINSDHTPIDPGKCYSVTDRPILDQNGNPTGRRTPAPVTDVCEVQ